MGLENVFEKEGMTNVAQQGQQEDNQQENQEQGSQEDNTQQTQQQPEGEAQEQGSQQESGEQQGEQPEGQGDQGEQQDKTEPSQEEILKHLNQSLGSNFKSIDDIKGLQSTQEKLKEYEAKIQEKDEALNSVGDPMNQFANENVAKANEILKNNNSLSFGVAAKLATADVDNMSDDDALVFEQLIENPHYEGRESVLRKMVNKTYKTDASSEDELSDEEKEEIEIQKFKKEADAKKAKDRLKQMANVETPQKRNVEEEHKQQKQQKLEQFKPHAESIMNELESVKVGKNGYEFQIDQSFKDFLQKDGNLASYLANNFDPNDPDAKQKAMDQLKEVYKKQKIDKIVDDIEEQVAARIRDEFHQKSHNPKQNNRQERPEPTNQEQQNQQAEQNLVKSLK